MQVALVVGSMMSISPTGCQDAFEAMRPANAVVAVAATLERAGHINSGGSYLRDLTRRATRGEIPLRAR
ncbi:hypothetical protein FVA81_02135 (plasmid) [Rhizobium sp. WL3]|nr:hypothetical protein FVA81_02135 [Rhizobium sp. WL3]